jgi:hypothetical protein
LCSRTQSLNLPLDPLRISKSDITASGNLQKRKVLELAKFAERVANISTIIKASN